MSFPLRAFCSVTGGRMRILGRISGTVLGIVLLARLLVKRVVVREWSMSPTVLPDEYLLIDRLAYRVGEPQRGDIVLARHPQRTDMLLIKRVVAVPHDQVRVDGEGGWVNGSLYAGDAASGPGSPARQWFLGAGQFFLLGDAPGISTDSRHFGPVARRAIMGKAWLVYWPVGRIRRLSDRR